MRISILCQFEENTACGIHMRGKADALSALGHPVTLVLHPFKYERRLRNRVESPAPNLTIRTFYTKFFEGRIGALSRLARLPAALRDMLRVFLLLRASDVTLLHKTLPLAMLYQVALKATGYRGKIVCVLDDWEGVGGMATLRHPDSILNKLLVTAAEEYMPAWADGNICVSDLLLARLELSRRTAGKNIYLPLGASPRALRETPPKAEAEPFRVCYVGSFKSRHLTSFLVRMMERTLQADPEVRFVVVGGGEEFESLREGAESLPRKDRIRLTGQVPHAEVLSILDEVDLCLVYINDAFPEAYLDASRSSTKMFEYMAMGKPILASRFGEPLRLLRDGETGWLAANSPEAFAECILRAKSDPAGGRRMGAALREEFESKYSHPVLMKRFLDWVGKP